MRNTTRALQKAIVQNLGSHSNVLIDTVARVQGLTTDVTIFFVPNTSYIRTIEPHLFNVATSRAKEHTIIIADKNILSYPTIKPLVRKYLERLKEEKSIYIPSNKNTMKTIGETLLLD
jgi:superfamily I DNA and/or RNA helicase